MKEKLTETGCFKILSEKEKVYFFLYDYPNSTRKDIVKGCYPVTSVTSVTCSSGKGNNSNKGNEVTSQYDMLKSMLWRYENKYLTIKSDKSDNEFKYSLTTKGETEVLQIYDKYRNEKAEREKQENDRKSIEDLKQEISNFCNDDIIQDQIEKSLSGKNFIEIDMNYLCKNYLLLHEKLVDDPENILLGIKNGLIDSQDNKIEYINIKNLSDSYKIDINKIRVDDIGKVRTIIAEIRSRSQAQILTNSILFECPSCGNSITVLQTDDYIRQPTRCGCGRKGKFKEKSRQPADLLKITVSDLYENISSYEVPEEINVYLENDSYGFETLQEGMKVKIHGVPILESVKNRQGRKSTISIKAFKCLGLEKLDNDYTKIYLNPDDDAILKSISQNPFKWFNQILFHDLHDVELPTQVATIGLFGDLHLLAVGYPGIGKSEIFERIVKAALRGKFVDCPNTSVPGLIGAATKNQFTDKYGIDRGVFKPMHPGGIVVLDEFNRGETSGFIQACIMGILNSNRLRINKANINLDYPCYVSIFGTLNPIYGKYDPNKTEYENFGINHPVWDRFDLPIYFINKFDPNNTELAVKLLNKNKIDFKIPKRELNIIRQYQIKSNLIDFRDDIETHRKLALILKKFCQPLDDNVSFRVLKTMKKIIKAISKTHLRNKPIDEDFRLMTDIIRNLHTAKQTFMSRE